METKAKDIMTRDVLKAVEGMTIEEGLRLLINTKITGAPVVDSKSRMVGVLSEYDIICSISKSEATDMSAFKKPIDFSKKVEAIDENTTLDTIMSMFVDSRYRRLPVINSNKELVGIISRRDIMRLFYYRARLA
jgi:CBS domain-containing protein